MSLKLFSYNYPEVFKDVYFKNIVISISKTNIKYFYSKIMSMSNDNVILTVTALDHKFHFYSSNFSF